MTDVNGEIKNSVMKQYCVILRVSIFGFLVVGCVHAPRVGEERTPTSAFKVIDAHTHFHSIQTKNFHQPSPEMLKEFEEAGVVGAVVHLGGKERNGLTVNRKAGPRLAVCAAITPDSVKLTEVEKGIQDGFYQCMKIYLGYVAKYPADPFYTPYYKLAEKKGVPVVFHTGDTYDKMAKVKFADPLGVDEIAVTYPKVKFVIAHLGNPWFDSCAEVVYKNDNVYVDLSALVIDDISRMDAETLEELVIRPIRWVFKYVENPKKFMFATDYPLTKIKPYLEVIKKAIPKEHWEDVFYNNAVSVFKL